MRVSISSLPDEEKELNAQHLAFSYYLIRCVSVSCSWKCPQVGHRAYRSNRPIIIIIRIVHEVHNKKLANMACP